MNNKYSKRILLLPLAVILIAMMAAAVSAGNAPEFVTSKLPNARANIQYTYQIEVTDENVSTVTFTADNKGWTRFQMDSKGKIQFTAIEDDIGFHTISITATDEENQSTPPRDFTIFVTDEDDDGSLVIKEVEIDDVTGDDEEHIPGDYLEISFDIDNKISKDFSDVKAKVWLAKLDGTRVGSRAETSEEDLDSKDSIPESVKLRIDPTAKSGTYYLWIKAEGTDEDDNDKSALYAEKINIDRNSHELMIDSVELSPANPVCGGKAEIRVLTYNVGSTTEDDIKLRVRSTEMNLNVYSEEFKLKTSGSSAKAEKSVLFDIPATAKGTYNLEVMLLYNGGSDSVSKFVNMPVTCGVTEAALLTGGAATITAGSTSASAQSGQTVKFAVTIKNTETTARTYQIALSGTTNWATANVEPTDVTLAPGTEMPVYVYITPKSGIYGDQTATVTVTSGAAVLATKTFTVQMPQQPTTTVTSRTTGVSTSDMELSNEAIVAIVVGIVIVAGGFVLSRYKANKVKVYGSKKKGRKSEEEEL